MCCVQLLPSVALLRFPKFGAPIDLRHTDSVVMCIQLLGVANVALLTLFAVSTSVRHGLTLNRVNPSTLCVCFRALARKC